MAVSLAMTSECRSSVTECQDGLFQQPEQFPSFSSRRLLCFPPVRLSSSPPEAALLGPGLVLSSCSLAHVAFPLLCFASASSRPEGKRFSRFSLLVRGAGSFPRISTETWKAAGDGGRTAMSAGRADSSTPRSSCSLSAWQVPRRCVTRKSSGGH